MESSNLGSLLLFYGRTFTKEAQFIRSGYCSGMLKLCMSEVASRITAIYPNSYNSLDRQLDVFRDVDAVWQSAMAALKSEGLPYGSASDFRDAVAKWYPEIVPALGW